ncbi:MAG: nucleotidyltransferase [Clostridia bacterium]|nr:nucleotidyltransferase [Clostridia bacterium]
MKVCGIIAEYNPLHCGHEYQLKLARQHFDSIVIIMSGSFTQRGDTAVIDKWQRAQCALLAGADLVLELPAVYAVSTAERFACGGVSVLEAIGCADALLFGSECGDISALTKAAERLADETQEVKDNIRSLMKSGISYASARTEAYKGIISGELLSKPNNILAIEYIKQLLLTGSRISPVTHKRSGSGYLDTKLPECRFASASAIRANLASPEKIKAYMPDSSFDILTKSEKYSLKNLGTAAAYFIRTAGPDALKSCLECTEGLENRIYSAAQSYSDIEQISDAACTKRYTRAKIRRIILNSMLGITREMCFIKPNYIRVLGASSNGQKLLSRIKENSCTDIITKVSAYKKKNTLFKKDILSTDIHALSASIESNRRCGSDFYTSPIMLQ